MAPADTLSPPGSSSYSSDTLNVGDGTWDYTKNTFLLPNLVGLNFATMQYNGMSNRFSTITQYHSLVLGHALLAVLVYLILIPISALTVRFYTGRPGYALRYHGYLNVLAVLFGTASFVLGFFAVGPARRLTNPHHGIGVALYVLILVQFVGGRLVRHVRGHSFRVHVHRWSGRLIVLLGIAQIPLGLTLYGSPVVTFVLYALWMTFLALVYFFLDYRDDRRLHDAGFAIDRRTEYATGIRRSDGGGGMGWLAPLVAGAGAWALLRGRGKDRKDRRDDRTERDYSRSPSRSPSPSTRISRAPSGRSRSHHRSEYVHSSRREDDSYREDERYREEEVEEKYGDNHDRRRKSSGGGMMNKILGVGAAVGAGALLGRLMNRREKNRDEEYSAVATDTPSKLSRRPRRDHHRRARSEYTDYTEDTASRVTPAPGRRRSSPGRRPSLGRQSPLLPAPGARQPASTIGRPEPTTPRRSHGAPSTRLESAMDASDYSSYVSPSRRPDPRKKSATPGSGDRGGGAGKGILAGIGLGWLANRMANRRKNANADRDNNDPDLAYGYDSRRRDEEDDRRAGNRGSRFTGDGHPSPTRQASTRRRISRQRPPPSGITTTASALSDPSTIEPPSRVPYDAVPPHPGAVPAPVPGSAPILVPAAPGVGVGSGRLVPPPAPGAPISPVEYPNMPPDPQGILYRESGSEEYFSAGGHPHRRHSERRRREGEAAAAAAAASASVLAAEEDDRWRRGQQGQSSQAQGPPQTQQPISVKVKVHDDPQRNVTLRRLTEEEAAASRRDRSSRRHNRNDSASTLSGAGGNDSGGGGGGGNGGGGNGNGNGRYRRESTSRGRRAAEAAAERAVEDPETLSPPNPAFAAGKRPKDSAYYSGAPPQPPSTPGGAGPSAGVGGGPAGATVSSLGSPASRATWSQLSPSPSQQPVGGDAAERRRKRRAERRDASRQGTTVDFN